MPRPKPAARTRPLIVELGPGHLAALGRIRAALDRRRADSTNVAAVRWAIDELAARLEGEGPPAGRNTVG